MTKPLLNYEWMLISQLLLRIYDTDTYSEFIDVVLRNLKGLIDFDQGVSFTARMEQGKPRLGTPFNMKSDGSYEDNTYYIENNYDPDWIKYFYCPWSSVFRYSDISGGIAEWEQSRIYKEVLWPHGLYYGLYATLVHNGRVLGAIVLWRSKEKGDFGDRDTQVVDRLKDHLALKLYRIVSRSEQAPARPGESKAAPSFVDWYDLTKREAEVAKMIGEGLELDDVCKALFISMSTLRKHISNIYRKTGAHNRRQLLEIMNTRYEDAGPKTDRNV